MSGTGADIGGERDDEPAPLTTIIVAEVDLDAREVLFRVVCPKNGLSPLYRLPNSSTADGNPYARYGNQAAQWCGVPAWNHLTLIVAQITSGSLKV
jgi:hypothetical protein